MIINIAGTNGAGKTTLVRKLIASATSVEPLNSAEKNSVVGHILDDRVVVIGQYREDLQTSGCDKIKDVPYTYTLIADLSVCGYHVVYEGSYVMDQTRGPALAHEHPVTVIRLTTPLPQVKADINVRRAAQGKSPKADWKSVEGNHTRARNFADRMEGAGAKVYRVDRDKAWEVLQELVRVD